jgi:hypothetical protein
VAVVRPASLSERTAAAASELLAGQGGGLRAYLAFVGPAVVASIAYMDPGNFWTAAFTAWVVDCLHGGTGERTTVRLRSSCALAMAALSKATTASD